MFRTANPAMNLDAFRAAETLETPRPADVMTVHGTASKTGILLGLLLITASWTWYLAANRPEQAALWLFGGLIAGLILALVTIFKKTAAPVTAPLYALAQGLVLGGISSFFEQAMQGIVIQAVALTFGVLGVMLFLYASRIIRVTNKLRMGIVAATGAIFLVYMISFVLSFFGVGVPFIHDASPIGIGISVLIVGVTAFNLLLDFDLIEQASAAGAPRYMEWYGAFGLMVTLIWLYLEILRLLSKLRER